MNMEPHENRHELLKVTPIGPSSTSACSLSPPRSASAHLRGFRPIEVDAVSRADEVHPFSLAGGIKDDVTSTAACISHLHKTLCT